MTNYEKIKAMSINEMAEFLSEQSDCFTCKVKELNKCGFDETCECSFKKWLKAEAKND